MLDYINRNVNNIAIGYRFDFSAETIGPHLLFSKILKDGTGTIYNDYVRGYTSSSYTDLISLIEKYNGNKLSETVAENKNAFYYWNDGKVVQLTMGPSGDFFLSAYSLDQDWLQKLIQEFEGKLCENVKQGYIFAIMRAVNGNLQLTRIGYAGENLERGNYKDDILKDHDYVINDLKSDNPSGRITILDGPAGSGKTFLTRAILTEVPDAMFVLVPPSMVSSLGGPDLLPLLLRNKEDYQKTGPTILILEDADECLVPRAADNMGSISSILNLGDGIFGSLFDIRIIATTNAKKAEMDPAIIRAGRLSKHIHIGHLNYDEANKIYQRLLPGKDLPKPESHKSEFRPAKEDKITLAEVYKAARDNGWIPPKKESKNSYDDFDY